MLLTILCDAQWDDSENNRVVMKLHPKIAPIKAVVCPLVKKKMGCQKLDTKLLMN